MPFEGARGDKQALRKQTAKRAAALSSAYRQEADAGMLTILRASVLYRQATSIFVYISMEGEPDTRGIIRDAWARGKRVYVPKCHGMGRMDAVAITCWDDVKPGRLNIPEPEEGEKLGAGETADVCIVPCVSAAREGTRLGHGAGYYDRWLADHGGYAVCLCYEEMICAQLPAEPWDVKMNAVLTEKGFFPCHTDKKETLLGETALLSQKSGFPQTPFREKRIGEATNIKIL